MSTPGGTWYHTSTRAMCLCASRAGDRRALIVVVFTHDVLTHDVRKQFRPIWYTRSLSRKNIRTRRGHFLTHRRKIRQGPSSVLMAYKRVRPPIILSQLKQPSRTGPATEACHVNELTEPSAWMRHPCNVRSQDIDTFEPVLAWSHTMCKTSLAVQINTGKKQVSCVRMYRVIHLWAQTTELVQTQCNPSYCTTPIL